MPAGSLSKPDGSAPSALMRFVRERGVPFALERSCRFRSGRIDRDRFLASVALEAFGRPPYAALFEGLAALGMPAPILQRARLAVGGAALVHFGHEGGLGATRTKVYFEYGDAAPGIEPDLVHRAFKWDTTGATDETLYRRVAVQGAAGLAEAIAARFAPGSAVGQCMDRLLRYPAVQRVARDLMLLDVVDLTSNRASIDLNLYRADMAVGQAVDLLATIGDHFGIAAEELDALAAALAPQALGHLAGGTDRGGALFMTLYHGAQAR